MYSLGVSLIYIVSLFSDNFIFTILVCEFYLDICVLCLAAGEWWNGDIDSVESEMMKYGGGPAISNAYTINGLPGPFYNCSNKGICPRVFITQEAKILP